MDDMNDIFGISSKIQCKNADKKPEGFYSSRQRSLMMHSQLLVRLKNEFKYKTTEGGGVKAHSLAHNTLRGKGACWSSRMELGRVDKLHSLTRAYT